MADDRGDTTFLVTMATTPLHTRRLTLRAPTGADAGTVHVLAGDRRVAGTTSSIPHPYKRAAAEEWIRSIGDGCATGRFVYAITLRTDGSLIGAASLVVERDRPIGNLGYWIGVPFWNRGYATEAAAELVRHGFESLCLMEIQAIHMTRNPASGRVLQKAGLSPAGSSIDLVRGELEPVERYRIVVDEWRSAHPLDE